jgi:hypothetical protein
MSISGIITLPKKDMWGCWMCSTHNKYTTYVCITCGSYRLKDDVIYREYHKCNYCVLKSPFIVNYTPDELRGIADCVEYKKKEKNLSDAQAVELMENEIELYAGQHPYKLIDNIDEVQCAYDKFSDSVQKLLHRQNVIIQLREMCNNIYYPLLIKAYNAEILKISKELSEYN